MKRIAILGATSQIAKDLVWSFAVLDSQDYELILFARCPDALIQWHENIGLKVRYQVLDIADFSNAMHFDAIFNFIGVGNPVQAMAMGALTFEITLKYDGLVLSYLQQHPSCRYIFLSSGAVYGSNFEVPVDHDTVATIAINNIQPCDWYSVDKLFAESRHRAFQELSIVDIRVFNYVSHTQNLDSSFLMTDIFKSILHQSVLKVSEEYIVRDFLHPSDFYQLVMAILSSPPINMAVDAYTLAPIDKPTLLTLMEDNFGLRYEVSQATLPENVASNKCFYYSMNKCAETLGYQPAMTSADGILMEIQRFLAGAT